MKKLLRKTTIIDEFYSKFGKNTKKKFQQGFLLYGASGKIHSKETWKSS